MRRPLLVVTATLCLLGTLPALAQEKIKIGILGQFSGPFAQSGVFFRQGIETFQSLYGTNAGGREVELVFRDIGGANAANAKRLAEELIVKEKVSLIGGFYLSSEAAAAAPVLSETKTPAVIFVASAVPVVLQSPYLVRASNTIWQDATAAAEFAAKSGKKSAYVAVADYAPGYDVQEYFKARFTALGGQVVGEDRMPLNTVDYAPFAERVANSNADTVMTFVPTGAPQISFMKAMAERNLLKRMTVIGFLIDTDLQLYDDSIIGFNVISFYAPTVQNEENRRFKQAFASKFHPGQPADAVRYNQFMVGAYDGMRVLYRMIESQKGRSFDADSAVESVRGFAWTGPSGPRKIEADTRDITTTEFVRRISKVDGHLEPVLVDSFPAMRSPSAPPRAK